MFLRRHFLGEKGVSEVESIIDNLNNVLKTKRGSGYFLQSFGLSDTGYRTSEEMITALTTEIAENVRLYEPRVELIDVDDEYDDEGERTRLVLHMKLRESDQELGLFVDLKKNTFEFRPKKPGDGR